MASSWTGCLPSNKHKAIAQVCSLRSTVVLGAQHRAMYCMCRDASACEEASTHAGVAAHEEASKDNEAILDGTAVSANGGVCQCQDSCSDTEALLMRAACQMSTAGTAPLHIDQAATDPGKRPHGCSQGLATVAKQLSVLFSAFVQPCILIPAVFLFLNQVHMWHNSRLTLAC